MDNAQKHNIFINVPWLQTFISYLHNYLVYLKKDTPEVTEYHFSFSHYLHLLLVQETWRAWMLAWHLHFLLWNMPVRCTWQAYNFKIFLFKSCQSLMDTVFIILWLLYLFSKFPWRNMCLYVCCRARGSLVGWGTMLQSGRSRVQFPMRSLDFLTDLILPAALKPWGRLSL
jgi:hypothetical protein